METAQVVYGIAKHPSSRYNRENILHSHFFKYSIIYLHYFQNLWNNLRILIWRLRDPLDLSVVDVDNEVVWELADILWVCVGGFWSRNALTFGEDGILLHSS